MAFKKFSLKTIALVIILLLGMVFIAGCGAKDSVPSAEPEKTTQDTQQPSDGQEPASEPQKEEDPAEKSVQEPAPSNQDSQDTSTGSIPKIPHAADANTDCLSCHKDGIAGAPKVPHPERQGCFSCHPLANK